MKWSWLTWLAVSATMAGYVAAGSVEATSTTTKIELIPGRAFELKLVRVVPNAIDFLLLFDGLETDRRELGKCCPTAATETPNLEVFTEPGASVQVSLSSSRVSPVTYVAWPAQRGDKLILERHMMGEIVDGQAAMWVQPPPEPRTEFMLYPGLNRVRLKVTSVDPALVGEAVQVRIEAPLSLKNAKPNTVWLFWGLVLWPVFAFIQIVWALVLIGATWIKSRRLAALRTERASG
ncbi:hypothetical protein [Microvirga roseola]|uniref:hypothetical protein n=1 Tax=Microvirga roseola TaxID=2883126 RepID=UPI001E49F5E2|nr:hypothetical protein [Microvirga roseola]